MERISHDPLAHSRNILSHKNGIMIQIVLKENVMGVLTAPCELGYVTRWFNENGIFFTR
jgi:hypothetical protein